MLKRFVCLLVAMFVFCMFGCANKTSNQCELSHFEKAQSEYAQKIYKLNGLALVKELEIEYANLERAYIAWLNKHKISTDGTTQKKKFPSDECARETYATLEYIKKWVDRAYSMYEAGEGEDVIFWIASNQQLLCYDMDRIHKYRKLDEEIILRMIFVDQVLQKLLDE